MHRTQGYDYIEESPVASGSGTVDQRRGQEHIAGVQIGTVDSAEWNNAIQEELCFLIEDVLGANVCNQSAATDRTAEWKQLYTAIFKSAALDSDSIGSLELGKMVDSTPGMVITRGDDTVDIDPLRLKYLGTGDKSSTIAPALITIVDDDDTPTETTTVSPTEIIIDSVAPDDVSISAQRIRFNTNVTGAYTAMSDGSLLIEDDETTPVEKTQILPGTLQALNNTKEVVSTLYSDGIKYWGDGHPTAEPTIRYNKMVIDLPLSISWTALPSGLGWRDNAGGSLNIDTGIPNGCQILGATVAFDKTGVGPAAVYTAPCELGLNTGGSAWEIDQVSIFSYHSPGVSTSTNARVTITFDGQNL